LERVAQGLQLELEVERKGHAATLATLRMTRERSIEAEPVVCTLRKQLEHAVSVCVSVCVCVCVD
jgi:hypothetical protein